MFRAFSSLRSALFAICLKVSSPSVSPSVPSGESGAFYQAIDEIPPEEIVLQELKMVMTLVMTEGLVILICCDA